SLAGLREYLALFLSFWIRGEPGTLHVCRLPKSRGLNHLTGNEDLSVRWERFVREAKSSLARYVSPALTFNWDSTHAMRHSSGMSPQLTSWAEALGARGRKESE